MTKATIHTYNRGMRNGNNNTKENTMKKFLTAKETEGMTLEQFQAVMREGRVEVRRESMDNVTADDVTMGGRFGCE